MIRIALLFCILPACLQPLEGADEEDESACLVTVSQNVDNPVYGLATCEEVRGYCCWYTKGEPGVQCKAPIDVAHRCECPPLHVNEDTDVECAGEVDEGVCYCTTMPGVDMVDAP